MRLFNPVAVIRKQLNLLINPGNVAACLCSKIRRIKTAHKEQTKRVYKGVLL